ncbi:hypothetical protein I4U23_007529 [Adineta vaga]|nr:hypothetical protein I4U23_007529 [Adineta vaga]
MQEKWQQMKIPPAWKPDEWVCHHSGGRQSTRMDNYSVYQQSKTRSAISYRTLEKSATPKRISTAKLRRQNLSLKSAEYRLSARKSKVKRLHDTLTPISYKSFYSYATHRHLPTPPIRIPKMSKQSLKRWLDARDAYLGHNYPYIQEGLVRHRRKRRQRNKSDKEMDKMIDYDGALSMFSMDSDRFTLPELISSSKQRRLSRKDSYTRRLSRSETNLRRSGGLIQRIKSFVRSPVASLNRLPCRKQRQQKKAQIIHDNFDDKCIGTDIHERVTFRTDIKRYDQSVQANLPRPRFELHHEFDTSMVVGERRQRIRSVRKDVEYRDKTTETDFIENFVNVLKEKKEENEVNAHKDDKATRTERGKEKIDSFTTEQYNVEHHQDNKYSLPSMSDSNQHQIKTKNEAIKSPKFTNTGNRIVPLTDLFHPSTVNNETEKSNESRSAMVTPTDSNISVHEQLHRLRTRFNRLSKERRLLTCLLTLFAIIMCGLLAGIFILSWAYQGRTSIIYREINSTNVGTTVEVARYGESCDKDSDCENPFICHKKGSSIPGMCRCPLKYDFVKDRCVGDLNALCIKDIDCQRYMLCTGMKDGTRQCQCQTQFHYDNERRRCRGDYEAPCGISADCRANLVCNKTVTSAFCSCESHYQYHLNGRKCRGNPGAVCDRMTAECVDNAECRDGACECSNQFVPDENKVCVDPCPTKLTAQARIRYPGNCRRFIDCQQKSKTECPEMTIFNLRTQLCDYPKNVFDCR